MGQSIEELQKRAAKGSRRAAKKLAQDVGVKTLPKYILVDIVNKKGEVKDKAFLELSLISGPKNLTVDRLYQVKKDGTRSKRKYKLKQGHMSKYIDMYLNLGMMALTR